MKQNKSLHLQQKESNLCITFQTLHIPQLSPPLKHRTNVDSGLTSFFIQNLFRPAISVSGFLFLAFLAGWAVTSNASCIFSATVTKWTLWQLHISAEECAEYFRHQWNVRCACAEEGGTEGGAGRRRHEGIWPIRAIWAEKQGLVSFFSVLQLPQRSVYFRSSLWIQNVLTALRIAGPFHPV